MTQQERRRLRGWILRMLASEYPSPMELSALAISLRAVFESATAKVVGVEVAYLDEKGYVERREQEVCCDLVITVKLTAKGKDLAEGNATDPGVAPRVV